MEQLLSLSNWDYINDTLIIAGDVSDSLERLEKLFSHLLKKFYALAFIPGNHELWLRKSTLAHSLEKLDAINQLCDSLGLHYRPFKVEAPHNSLWIVPLFSWYQKPEEGTNSLYIAKQEENWKTCGWMDDVLCHWPDHIHQQHDSVADYFLGLNHQHLERDYDAPVISFSHFLPRADLIFHSRDLADRYTQAGAVIPPHPQDPHPQFNFSRVAGCSKLEQQIRQIKPIAHIYGHQHRNRCRHIDGITYISHCLGNIKEQRALNYSAKPLEIWRDGKLTVTLDRL